VRVERRPDGAELQATALPDGEDTPSTKRPTVRRTRRLSAAEWQSIEAAVQAADYWRMPSPETRPGEDGETWVFEGLRGGQYHAVTRWEPREDSAYHALGARLLKLADLPP
jgi:hypothetical protein